ncbi:hypothetical protein AMTRI_Chr13g83990 [Amborella trichopoda]
MIIYMTYYCQTAVASASLKHMEEEVMCLTSKREKMLNKITNDRQWLKFLKCDYDFLFSKKDVLKCRILNLNNQINTLRDSTSTFIQEIIAGLRTTNFELQSNIGVGNLENEKLLKDIHELRSSLCAIKTIDDNSCILLQIAANEEEIIKLRGCIGGFQAQLALYACKG